MIGIPKLHVEVFKSLVFLGARSLPTGCARCAGEHGPRTASDWQAGSELAWFAPQFHFCFIRLAVAGGLRVLHHLTDSGQTIFNLDSSGAGVTRCHSCLLAHARSRRVARGMQGSTDQERHPLGRLAVSLLGSPRSLICFCIWLAVAACVCDLAFSACRVI